jgi:hypothetical protein
MKVEVVPFAALGLKVVQEVIPAYCSKFSKRMFTQRQLFAILDSVG